MVEYGTAGSEALKEAVTAPGSLHALRTVRVPVADGFRVRLRRCTGLAVMMFAQLESFSVDAVSVCSRSTLRPQLAADAMNVIAARQARLIHILVGSKSGLMTFEF
ncbi:hypothetical protein C5C37_12390 [Rathayibacter sp. AY1F9]|nr:hypothetical protein C5C37_12390 [Rathayibacter sp. AY1F9]